MATDVDVQYFSHLNGLTLGNNWGDMIRLLDKALVSGIDFTQITVASIDPQGDVHITLYAAHNAMLFQVVELSGFAPSSLNQKYRIKGVPSTTELILKPQTVITETAITITGAGKLGSLGYEIVFRDTNDVKRVYRAKNPLAKHPFIRIDETISDGTNSYTSTYAKYAMVGLLENMTHIDDYENTNVLQLPFDPTSPAKNWKITGTGTSVVRGWARWPWAWSTDYFGNTPATTAPTAGNRGFTLAGNKDAFYFQPSLLPSTSVIPKPIFGLGMFDAVDDSGITPNWFLSAYVAQRAASAGFDPFSLAGCSFMCWAASQSKTYITKVDNANYLKSSITADPIIPNYSTGVTTYATKPDITAMQVPIKDDDSYLRGTMHHICYCSKTLNVSRTTPMLGGNSMYVAESAAAQGAGGGVYYYLGEI